MLASFMNQNKYLARNKANNNLYLKLWNDLVEKVNNAGPPQKDLKEWQRVWKDLKYRVRKKYLAKLNGGDSSKILTPLEDIIAQAIGLYELPIPIPGVQSYGIKTIYSDRSKFVNTKEKLVHMEIGQPRKREDDYKFCTKNETALKQDTMTGCLDQATDDSTGSFCNKDNHETVSEAKMFSAYIGNEMKQIIDESILVELKQNIMNCIFDAQISLLKNK